MTWFDACMATPFRAATRNDERGQWRIDVDGALELVARDCAWTRKRGMEPGQIYNMSKQYADEYRDWESNG